MTVLYERNHETEFLILGQNPPAVPDTVTVTVSGTQPWLPSQVLGRITATGKYVKYTPGASDGSQIAAGVLWTWLPPVAGDARVGALIRNAEVNAAKLIDVDAAAAASLTAVGVLVRAGAYSETTYVTPGYVDPGYFA